MKTTIKLNGKAKTQPVDHVSVSASKKRKSSRQMFLSKLMSLTSGDAGEAMAEAFAKGRADELQELLSEVVGEMVKAAGRRK